MSYGEEQRSPSLLDLMKAIEGRYGLTLVRILGEKGEVGYMTFYEDVNKMSHIDTQALRQSVSNLVRTGIIVEKGDKLKTFFLSPVGKTFYTSYKSACTKATKI